MLGKMVWDIRCNSDKLWVSLLRHKYVGDKFFLDMPKTQGSIVWQSIMKAKAAFQNRFDYRLEMGLLPFGMQHGLNFGSCVNKFYILILMMFP